MKRILLLLLVNISSFAQTYKFAVGSNITSYVFKDATGTNQPFFRPSSGLHLSFSRESTLYKSFLYDIGVNYNQFNSVGDVQNIPYSYATDFIGLGAGVGRSFSFGKGITLVVKLNLASSKMVNGNQFLANRYVDLSGNDQFNSLRTMFGYSLELTKQINPQLGAFVKYQHLDSYNFGSSTLNLIPSTFSIGLSLNK